MATLKTRLVALESSGQDGEARHLPQLVPDNTSDAELARLRQHGREVYRESDPAFIEIFI